jgi:hypothetical protein
VSQLLITDAMLDDAAQALKEHRRTKRGCSCGSTTTDVKRHQAEVVADAIAPPLVAEMMDLLAEVRAS